MFRGLEQQHHLNLEENIVLDSQLRYFFASTQCDQRQTLPVLWCGDEHLCECSGCSQARFGWLLPCHDVSYVEVDHCRQVSCMQLHALTVNI